jgi:hypothetical protein
MKTIIRICVVNSVAITFLLIASLPRAVAQESSSEIAKLKEENARLKMELTIANAKLDELSAVVSRTTRSQTQFAQEQTLKTSAETDAVRRQLESLRERYAEGHPLVVQKKAELEAVATMPQKARQPSTQEILKLQRELEQLRGKYTDSHPLIQQKLAQLEALKQQLGIPK